MVQNGYPTVALSNAHDVTHKRQLATAINNVQSGKLNVVYGQLTINISATSTTITDPRISATNAILLIPTTANAATVEWYIAPSNQTTGRAIINHPSSSNTDQTFTVVIIG